MPATTMIRVPGVPFPLAFGDHTHDRFWSTSVMAAAQAATLQILAAAPGETKPGAAVVLTTRESNLPAGGGRGMPDGYEEYVYSTQLVLGPKYNASAVPTAGTPPDTDLLQIFARTKFTFRIQNKIKSEGPVYKFPAGSGLWMTGFDTRVAVNRGYSNNGVPSPRDQSAYILPHRLEPNVPFRGEFEFEAALAMAQTMDIEGHIEGLVKRPVV